MRKGVEMPNGVCATQSQAVAVPVPQPWNTHYDYHDYTVVEGKVRKKGEVGSVNIMVFFAL